MKYFNFILFYKQQEKTLIFLKFIQQNLKKYLIGDETSEFLKRLKKKNVKTKFQEFQNIMKLYILYLKIT